MVASVLHTAAAGIAPTYTATGSQISFILNTAKLNFTAAESWCALNGGHLAAFVDKDEQASPGAASFCLSCSCRHGATLERFL